MTRLFLKETAIHSDTIQLDPDLHHYLSHVLRVKPNDVLDIVVQNKAHKQIRVTALYKTHLTFIMLNEIPIIQKSLQITLAQALPKQDKFSEIIKKCTELGIDHIIPIESTFSISKPHDSQQANKQDRWQKIAQSASEQCRRLDIPSIGKITKLKNIGTELDLDHYDLKLVCWEGERSTHLKQVLQEKTPRHILLLIGPEGGIGQEEITMLIKLGFKSVTIAETILRAENAAFLTIGNILYEYTR